MKNFLFVFLSISISIFAISLPFESHAGSGTAFNKIVFFGDSLSDNGNLYKADYGYLPKSPPYFEGKFTNGLVWSEYAARYFYDKNYIGSTNFAIGGETAIFHNPTNGYLPYSLGASADSYWARTLRQDRSHTLFVIWIGANDYLNGTNNVETLTTDVTNNIKAVIENLIVEGGMNFLIVNLPDLSRTPYAIQNNVQEVFGKSALIHNQKLATIVQNISEGYKQINIQLFDLNALFLDMLDHINNYNEKFKLNIINTQDSCWQGGYRLRKNDVDSKMINEEQIYQELIAQKKLKYATSNNLQTSSLLPYKMDDKQLAHYIITSPALLEAHSLKVKAEAEIKPCKNPENYIFWDQIHPTAIVHKILSDYLINFIEEHFKNE